MNDAGIDLVLWDEDPASHLLHAKAAVLVAPTVRWCPGPEVLEALGTEIGAFQANRAGYDSGSVEAAEFDALTRQMDSRRSRVEAGQLDDDIAAYANRFLDPGDDESDVSLSPEFAGLLKLRNLRRLGFDIATVGSGFDFGRLRPGFLSAETYPSGELEGITTDHDLTSLAQLARRLVVHPGRVVLDQTSEAAPRDATVGFHALRSQIDTDARDEIDVSASEKFDAALKVAEAAVEAKHATRRADVVEANLAAIAHHHLMTSLPFLDRYPLDLVLEWADELADSMAAYRYRVHELLNGSGAELIAADGAKLAEYVSGLLDAEYDDLRSRIQGHTLWKNTKKNFPSWFAGNIMGLVPSLQLGLLSVLAMNASVTTGVGLRTALQTLLDQREFNNHEAPLAPTYWRYRLEPQNWKTMPRWWKE